MNRKQEEFEKQYKIDVETEAKYVLNDILAEALSKGYEKDIYARHVTNKMHELMKAGVEDE